MATLSANIVSPVRAWRSDDVIFLSLEAGCYVALNLDEAQAVLSQMEHLLCEARAEAYRTAHPVSESDE